MENQKSKLVLDIVALAMEISETTDADVMTEYSGHVQQLALRCFDDGWKERNQEPDCRHSCYLDNRDCTKTLNSMKIKLTDLLAQKRKEQEDAANFD